MKTKDVVIGLVVLVVLITAVLVIKRSINKKTALNVQPQQVSIQQKVRDTFPGFVIPDNSVKANLIDVAGGEGFGVVTENEILANLPDAPVGKTYKVWLENSQGKTILLGNLRSAKGGYLIEYNQSRYPGYNKVIVTLDNQHILEGSF